VKPPIAAVTKYPSPETLKPPAMGSAGFISRKDAAEYLCISEQQIDKWRANGVLPERRVGRKIIFCRADLLWRVEKGLLGPLPRPKGKVQQ
jgi:Helix-turn-helix domain